MATINLASFPLTETFGCPKCHQNITLHDPAGSEFVMCQHCHAYIYFHGSDIPKTNKSFTKPLVPPLLKIGSEATLKDVHFKVIAYLEKKEKKTKYRWREYILYNFEKGYATLVEFDGHWSFIVNEAWEKPEAAPTFHGTGAFYNQIEYKLFNRYTPQLTAMEGEIDYDVFNDSPNTQEFVAPPKILVREGMNVAGQTSDVYFGEYIDANEIATAFKIDPALFPSIVGVGAIEPSKHYERWENSYRICGVAIIAVLILQLLVGWIKPEVELLNSDFSISPLPNSTNFEFKSFVSPTFTLEDASSSIELEFSSAVDNNWMEATMVLVNEKDNRTWEVSKGIEFYHGVEDGESWTEGDQKGYILLPAIPAGKYHINVYPAAGEFNQSNLYIKATANTTIWRNALLTILAFMLYPIYTWIRMRNFEKKRWSNSDFSPFDNE